MSNSSNQPAGKSRAGEIPCLVPGCNHLFLYDNRLAVGDYPFKESYFLTTLGALPNYNTVLDKGKFQTVDELTHQSMRRRARCYRQCWTCDRLLPDELFTEGFSIWSSQYEVWHLPRVERELAENEKRHAYEQARAARENAKPYVFTEEEEEMLERERVTCAGPGCYRLFDRGDPVMDGLIQEGAIPPTADADSLAQTVKIMREGIVTPPSDEVVALLRAKSGERFCLIPGCCKLIPKDWFENARLIWQAGMSRESARRGLYIKLSLLLLAERQRANADAAEEEEDEFEPEPATSEMTTDEHTPTDVVIMSDSSEQPAGESRAGEIPCLIPGCDRFFPCNKEVADFTTQGAVPKYRTTLLTSRTMPGRLYCSRQCESCDRLLPDAFSTESLMFVPPTEEAWSRGAEFSYEYAQWKIKELNSHPGTYTKEEGEMLSRERVSCVVPGCNRLFDRDDPLIEFTRKGAVPPYAIDSVSGRLQCLVHNCYKWFADADRPKAEETIRVWDMKRVIPLQTSWEITKIMSNVESEGEEDEL